MATLLVDLGKDEGSSAWDVNAHVIATASISFGECLMSILGIDAIEASELGRIGVENDFVRASNLNA